MRPATLLSLTATACVLLSSLPAFAGDTDGPDCGVAKSDFGDAPEGIPTYFGVIAHFPTCITPGPAGTRDLFCAAISSAPGPTGYMRNVQDGTANYWIGCYPVGGALTGIDTEADCPAPDGDETFGDGSDSGVVPEFGYAFLCGTPNRVRISTANCGADRTAYLNVLVDLNHDGDWNDNMQCLVPGGYCNIDCIVAPCLYEWEVKNQAVVVPAGCGQVLSSFFRVSQMFGPTWVRVSLTDVPVDDDYPWAGSELRPGGSYAGGETEDLLSYIDLPDAARPSTWGKVKLHWR